MDASGSFHLFESVVVVQVPSDVGEHPVPVLWAVLQSKCKSSLAMMLVNVVGEAEADAYV